MEAQIGDEPASIYACAVCSPLVTDEGSSEEPFIDIGKEGGGVVHTEASMEEVGRAG